MKVFRSTPWVLADESCCSPEPSTKRKSSGCASEVTIRTRSLRKRISSRRQTTLIARSSLRKLRGGTRTVTTGAGAPSAVPLYRRPPPPIIWAANLFFVRAPPSDSSASRIVVPVWDMKTS